MYSGSVSLRHFVRCGLLRSARVRFAPGPTALARQTRMLMITMASFMLTIWVPLTVTALT